MTGEEFYQKYKDNIFCCNDFEGLRKLEKIEWFSRHSHNQLNKIEGHQIITNWANDFIAKNIPCAIIVTDTMVALYKEPFVDNWTRLDGPSCAEVRYSG
ncbi:MAG: hypothetical protein ACFFDN_50910 [Candidatus Hodarchaeota archaeon]